MVKPWLFDQRTDKEYTTRESLIIWFWDQQERQRDRESPISTQDRGLLTLIFRTSTCRPRSGYCILLGNKYTAREGDEINYLYPGLAPQSLGYRHAINQPGCQCALYVTTAHKLKNQITGIVYRLILCLYYLCKPFHLLFVFLAQE